MSRSDAHPLNELCNSVSLYALGALPREDKVSFELHLSEGCPACKKELRAFEQITGLLGYAAVPVTPPAALREDLLRQAQEPSSPPEQPPPETMGSVLFKERGLLISRSVGMDWAPAGLPGIAKKMLFRDPNRKYATQLVRMEAGTSYPSHQHRDAEEVYLLEGDLLVEGQVMQPGDYCHAETDSIHGTISTKKGALFLALSSEHDELLA